MTTVDPVAQLEQIITAGSHHGTNDHWLTCPDGFRVSVLAEASAYCTPRPHPVEHGFSRDRTWSGTFTHVEVGFPTMRPEPWDEWAQYCDAPDCPTETVYGYVPVDMVRALIASHCTSVAVQAEPDTAH
jgi:hypothetical protein